MGPIEASVKERAKEARAALFGVALPTPLVLPADTDPKDLIIAELQRRNAQLRQQYDDLLDEVGALPLGRGEKIRKAVANRYGIRISELRSVSRETRIVVPRQHAMWLTRRFTILSFPAIARLYNRTDHTTVMHACKAHEKRLEAGETFPQIPGWEV